MIRFKYNFFLISLLIIQLITFSIPSIAYTETVIPTLGEIQASIDITEPTLIENDPTIDSAPAESALRAYNHAYQENYETDSLDLLLAEAVDAYILLDPDDLTTETLTLLKENGNQLSAYISIGTGENWRSDFDELLPYLTKTEWAEWKGERFIRRISPEVILLMKKRIDRIAEHGYDWIEFDNMDFAFDDTAKSQYGIAVSEDAAIAYYQTLADYAHEKGLKVMAKNTMKQIDSFDGVTFESYESDYNWWDETLLKAFMIHDKKCFIVHYNAPNPPKSYQYYKTLYGQSIWFIAESNFLKEYVHFN